jgi:hypothetical protein
MRFCQSAGCKLLPEMRREDLIDQSFFYGSLFVSRNVLSDYASITAQSIDSRYINKLKD